VHNGFRAFSRRLAGPAVLTLAMAVAVAACGSAVVSHSGQPSTASATQTAGPGTIFTGVPLATPSTSTTPAPGSLAGAEALQSQMVAVVKLVTPSVVQIETSSGLGSGVIYDSSGDIVTNAHVAGTDTTFKVTLSSGKVYTGSLVGTYAPDDVAVIKISASGLTPATFGDSGSLFVGDFVLAMGNPLGLQSSVTEGIVSALGRSLTEPNGNALPDVIQTSAAINPGNSGGALVDLEGQVVGIPTLGAVDQQIGGSAPGIGFAISSNRARFIADQLITSGKVTSSGRGFLGIRLTDYGQGVVVTSVEAGGPAARAGIVAGDTITSVAGQTTPDASTLAEVVVTLKPGTVVKVGLRHQNGKTSTVDLTVGQYPSS
jgi:putative serine protease PepD